VAKPPRLTENGRPVSELVAENLGADKAIAIAVDRSKSMEGKPLADAVAAARLFLQTKREGDRVALFTFSSTADQLTDFSSNAADVEDALEGLTASGDEGTALYDAVTEAADGLARDELVGRVLILITDGHDVSRQGSLGEAITTARDVGVAVYPIGIGAGAQSSPEPLKRLARATGAAYSEATSRPPPQPHLGAQLPNDRTAGPARALHAGAAGGRLRGENAPDPGGRRAKAQRIGRLGVPVPLAGREPARRAPRRRRDSPCGDVRVRRAERAARPPSPRAARAARGDRD
jgi:hypothetical protein